jgi:hypothetical protein
MKNQIIAIIVLALAVSQFWACGDNGGIFSRVNGSGKLTEIEYNYENFQRIEISNAIELTVNQSDSFYVSLMVDDNVVNYLEVSKSGNYLIIDLKDNHSYNNVTLRAEVHMPEIDYFVGSGATVTTMNGFTDTTSFRLKLSGASVFSSGLIADDCEMDLSGASVINMNGFCNNLSVEASGASELNMGNFTTKTAYFKLSGASDGTTRISDYLDVKLSGASVLRYYGNPEIGNQDITGASQLIKM